MVFVDTLYGWASGDSGTVIHTTNGGTNWFVQATLTTWVINWITFLNRDTGWVLYNTYSSGGTAFMKTTDGGYNWLNMPNPDSTVTFITMKFLDQNRGFAGGDGARPYRTIDGGNSWLLCQTDSTIYGHLPMRRIKFYDSNIGFASGGQFDFGGVIWHTTDAGASWTSMIVSPEPEFDLQINSTSVLYGIGGDLEYGSAAVYTSNSGANWTYENLQCSGIGYTLAFRTPSEVWVPMGFGERWAVSLDSGNIGTWTCIFNADSSAVYDALFVSPTFGWACGNVTRYSIGTLLKYNPGIIGIHSINNTIPEKFSLSQNYPNPFNPVTIIKYQVSGRMFVTLKVYDLIGRLVTTLVNEEKDAGYYQANFDGSNLASGLYLYKFEARSGISGSIVYSGTKKMVLLK